jgi:flagellar FliL protein
MSDAAAVPEEVEAKPKKPIVKIILAVLALVLLVSGTMVGTLFITGFFNKPVPSADAMIAEGGDGHGEKPAGDGH